jgi:anti-anti-sigma factor
MSRMAGPFVSEEDACALDSRAQASFGLHHVQGCAVVVAAGEIDLCTSSALHDALSEAAKTADRVIIDLTGVTFLDSTGMGAMVDALNQDHHRQRGTLCLVGPSGSVRKALEITQLTKMFPIYPAVEEAVSELA